MNNIVISDLYKRIQTLCNYFKFDNNLYNTLYSILKQGVFSNRTLNILNDVKKIRGLDNNTLGFVNKITEDIITVGKKIEEINETKQKLNEKLEILKEEFKKRNLPTDELKIVERNNLDSFKEIEDYLNLLKAEDKRLDEIKAALNREKQAVEEFDDAFKLDTELVNKKAFEEKNMIYVAEEDHSELERKDTHVIEREMDNNIGGKVGPNILLVIVTILVLCVSFVIANGIFNFLKG